MACGAIFLYLVNGMRNKIIPYNPELKKLARQLRKQMTFAEVLLWQEIRKRDFGVQFHRQVPVLNYILDFYCHELLLAIEVDGLTHGFEGMEIKDAERQKAIEAYGVEFIRFDDEKVRKHIDQVLMQLYDKEEELKKKYGIL